MHPSGPCAPSSPQWRTGAAWGPGRAALVHRSPRCPRTDAAGSAPGCSCCFLTDAPIPGGHRSLPHRGPQGPRQAQRPEELTADRQVAELPLLLSCGLCQSWVPREIEPMRAGIYYTDYGGREVPRLADGKRGTQRSPSFSPSRGRRQLVPSSALSGGGASCGGAALCSLGPHPSEEARQH